MTRSKKKSRLIAQHSVLTGVLASWLAATSALAQTDSNVLMAVRACSEIADDSARLACFDTALASEGLAPAAAGPAPEPVARQAPQPVAVPAAAVEAEDESTRVVEIVEIRRNDLGWTWFVTADGAEYLQRGGEAGRFPPVPFEAELEPAMGNSYFLNSPLGGRRARVTATQ